MSAPPISDHRSLAARAEAAVAQARRLAAEHHALLAAVRQTLRDGPVSSPPAGRPPERI
ncbi:hypothetical protein [Methylobacterium nodulans]|nr:hypothetical protein [Methylobacterium nodulans]